MKDLHGLVSNEQWHSRSTSGAARACGACVCVCVCVCQCVSVSYAHPTSLQMSSGRAKCPLDDMLPIQVCLRTNLASIVHSNGPESGTLHAGKHRGFVCGNCFPNLALNQSKPTRRSQIIFLLQWGDQVIYRINLFLKREGKLEAIMRTLGWDGV